MENPEKMWIFQEKMEVFNGKTKKKSGVYGKPRKNMGFSRKDRGLWETQKKFGFFKLDENEEDQIQFLQLIVAI